VWRKNVAQEMNVPPYVIFGDKTMYDIAVKKPRDLSELLNVHGIGQAKAEQFGRRILKIVRND
jgi:ATP-dependent DNA helicase RecQ